MMDDTDRFALPLIAVGQAQKEVTHNEAIAAIDRLLHPVAETAVLAVPPSDPQPGRGWIVAAGPTGAWAGRADQLAVWTPGGWRFAVPQPGMLVWVSDRGLPARWTGTAWSIGHWPVASLLCGGEQVVGPRAPAIMAPAGGATVDGEVRIAVAAILTALRNHGLIAT